MRFARFLALIQRLWHHVLKSLRWGERQSRLLIERREALSLPVRWRWLRWIDRPLARLLRTKPRMLSSRVSVERVPFRGPLRLRIKLWLWELHSVRSGICLAIALGVGLCALALGAAMVCDVPMLGPHGDIDGIPMTLVATAGYSGALFGFLQAVAIFAVQLRSQQDTSMLPLIPLIARRYFTFLILGSVAGVTIANLLASFAAPILLDDRSSLAALTWINLLAVPAATLAAFWYLSAIVSEAGDADMDIALPVLRATMRAQSRSDTLRVAMLSAYISALDNAHIEYNPFAELRLTTKNKLIQRIQLQKSGVVHDLDCIRLESIRKIVEQFSPRPEVAITVAIDQHVPSNCAMILAWSSGGPTPHATPPPSWSDDIQRRLESSLNAAIFVRTQENP